MKKNKKNKKNVKLKQQADFKTVDKNYTNALDLEYLSCYNHTKEKKKQDKKDIRKLNGKNKKKGKNK